MEAEENFLKQKSVYSGITLQAEVLRGGQNQ